MRIYKILMLLTLVFLGARTAAAHASDELLESYALSPRFHSILGANPQADGKCGFDARISVDFSGLFGPNHVSLGNQVLNIYAFTEIERAAFRKFEIIGRTLDKSASVTVRFVVSAEDAETLVSGWTKVPKKRSFFITQDPKCVDSQYKLAYDFYFDVR